MFKVILKPIVNNTSGICRTVIWFILFLTETITNTDFSIEITGPITQTGKFHLGKSDFTLQSLAFLTVKLRWQKKAYVQPLIKEKNYAADFKLEVVKIC